MVEDIREQFIQDNEVFEREELVRSDRPFLGLQPWQRFVLALLLFLDIAVCGLMGLTVLGRVNLPF
jgi:hypothetical protein